MPVTEVASDDIARVHVRRLRHAPDARLARDFGTAVASLQPQQYSRFPGKEDTLVRPTLFLSQRTVAAPYLYPLNHVMVAFTIHGAASLLRHPHRLLSLYRIYFCHLCVQET